jgi:4-amino-4-deoxy-L-arabinose transferase-like glycosyltransferase
MNPTQRRTLWVLSVIGLVYFCLFIYPNSFGAGSLAILLDASGDEYVTYPTLVRILMPGETLLDTRANLFLYEDYHYGYPFYAISALAVLPVRLIYGTAYGEQIQLNLLLLRQLISLLPMILAAGVLVYLQTRFQSLFQSAALFVFLLSIRGVVRNHIWWWHPDALAVLFAVLTLFFLDRDRLRFGRNFWLAALFCGLATAIKLLGVFFFLTIAAYLVVGLARGRIRMARAVLAGGLFVVIMAAVVVLANPFLFSDDQRARMLEIQAQKTQELSQGYEHDDPLYYSKGPRWWVTVLEKWYAPPLFLVYLTGALIAGCIWGPRRFTNRLILTWVLPYSIYLLYFVAVKPDHYWLPVMLPLFSAALIPFEILARPGGWLAQPWDARKLAQAALALLLVGQFALHLARPVSGNLTVYTTAIQRGMVQIR